MLETLVLVSRVDTLCWLILTLAGFISYLLLVCWLLLKYPACGINHLSMDESGVTQPKIIESLMCQHLLIV